MLRLLRTVPGCVLLLAGIVGCGGGPAYDPRYPPRGHGLSGHEWDGESLYGAHGTVDPTGQGNDVYGLGGEPIYLPN